jgi:glucose/arabinose dehydrogenase
MNLPRGIAIDSAGNIFIADSNNHVIYRHAGNPSGGNKIIYAGQLNNAGYLNGNTPTTSLFRNPFALCFDKYDNMYIADYSNNSIRKISKSGKVSTLIGNVAGNAIGTLDNTKLRSPSDVKIGKDGCLYIVETGNGCIKKVDLNLG